VDDVRRSPLIDFIISEVEKEKARLRNFCKIASAGEGGA